LADDVPRHLGPHRFKSRLMRGDRFLEWKQVSLHAGGIVVSGGGLPSPKDTARQQR